MSMKWLDRLLFGAAALMVAHLFFYAMTGLTLWAPANEDIGRAMVLVYLHLAVFAGAGVRVAMRL